MDQAGVGVGLVAEAGEPWRFHASNVQAAVESLGVAVQAAALQDGYATPDDAVRALENSLHVHDWSGDGGLATRGRRGDSPGRRYRQRLKARLEEWFSYEWPGLATGHARLPVIDHGQEVATLTIEKFTSYDTPRPRTDVGIWRAPGARLSPTAGRSATPVILAKRPAGCSPVGRRLVQACFIPRPGDSSAALSTRHSSSRPIRRRDEQADGGGEHAEDEPVDEFGSEGVPGLG